MPLSIAITVTGGFLARAKLSACLNIANPKMSGALEAAAEQWQGGGRAQTWVLAQDQSLPWAGSLQCAGATPEL